MSTTISRYPRALQFLTWYYGARPLEIIDAWVQYAHAFSEVFSFVFLIRTLFAPWKSIKDAYPRRGFNLNAIAQTFTLNVTARVIGFIFRVFALLTGIVIEFSVAALFAVYLAAWVVFPFLLFLSIPYVLTLSVR